MQLLLNQNIPAQPHIPIRKALLDILELYTEKHVFMLCFIIEWMKSVSGILSDFPFIFH